MRGFITVDRQTDYLLPPSVEDWLPQEVQQLIALAESEGRKNVPDGTGVPREISVSQSLAGGVVFRVDQAPSSDQTASWNIGERG